MATMRHHPLSPTLTLDLSDIDDQESGPDAPLREAKRRRIETIATQYLQGSAPFILSAALRGPFDASWQNPWAKEKPARRAPSSRPAASTARRRRQTTREPSVPPPSSHLPPKRSGRHERLAASTNPRDRERLARAEAEHLENERRKAKAERREQRRRDLRVREEKAFELRKDGYGTSPAQPVDLTGASFNTRLTAEVLGDDRPAAVNTEVKDITRSKEYGSREIRSSFTDEWIHRLGSPARTPELSPVRNSRFEEQVDTLEALTPTKSPQNRPDVDRSGAAGSSRLKLKPRSERQRSLVPESRHTSRLDRRKPPYLPTRGDDAVTEDDLDVRKPSTAPLASFRKPKDPSLKPPIGGTQERIGPAREYSNSRQSGRVESSMHSSSQTGLQKKALPEKASFSRQERVNGVRRNTSHTAEQGPGAASAPNYALSRVAARRRRKQTSGFTPINPRFSSPQAEHSEPVVSTTAGRPILGVKAATNNANPADLTRASLQPRDEGILVMSAGDIHHENEPLYALDRGFIEKETNFHTDENKIAGNPSLKEALVQSAEHCVTSGSRKPRKLKKVHPLHASPIATNSPGFVYRKVSNPTINTPKLQPTSQVNKEADKRKKKRARLMTFESQPAEAASLEMKDPDPQNEDQPIVANGVEEEREDAVVGSQAARDNESSPTRDLSTQAAVLFAQQEFQQEFRSPQKNAPAESPGKVSGSQQTRTSTPPPSAPPVKLSPITPFKTFNRGKSFLEDNPFQPELAPVSTQELFNAATPFAFSTVKKNSNKRKRVSLADSPVKSAGDHAAVVPAGANDAGGETTAAVVTFGDKSTTPPTPKSPGFARSGPPSSGLKPLSLNPPLPSALRRRSPPKFTGASLRVPSSQVSSSCPHLALPPSLPPPSTAPVSSHPVRQEYRRAQNQGGGSSSPQHQPAQRQLLQPAFLDDVDLDSAMDAADSFLDTANFGVDLRSSTTTTTQRRSGARRV